MNRLIEVNPRVMLGKPVIRGTRITVASILERLGAGEAQEAILEAHPQLSSDAIRAALAYAAEVLSGEVVDQLDSSHVHRSGQHDAGS